MFLSGLVIHSEITSYIQQYMNGLVIVYINSWYQFVIVKFEFLNFVMRFL